MDAVEGVEVIVGSYEELTLGYRLEKDLEGATVADAYHIKLQSFQLFVLKQLNPSY